MIEGPDHEPNASDLRGRRVHRIADRPPGVFAAARQLPSSARLETASATEYAAAPEMTFEFGLAAILDGLEARLDERQAPAAGTARTRPGTTST